MRAALRAVERAGGVLYRIGDFAFRSSVRFPELQPGSNVTPECGFTFANQSAARCEPGQPIHEWALADGTSWLRVARRDCGYLLGFSELADFLVSADASDITCYRRPGVPLNTIRHLFLDQVLPLVLAHRGRLVLHAGAVATPAGAVAFLGESGRGKSTLTAALCRVDTSLLTDDCLLLSQKDGGWEVVPSYPGLRLWPDAQRALFGREVKGRAVSHYTVKRRVDSRGAGIAFASGAAPLRCLFILGAPEDAPQAGAVSAEAVSGSDAFVELAKYSYLLDIEDPAQLRRQFAQLGRLASQVPIIRLNYARDLSLLASVCQAVVDYATRATRPIG